MPSEMEMWIGQLMSDRVFTRPGGEGPYPIENPPVVTPPVETAPPVASAPVPGETPAAGGVPPLQALAQHLRNGGLLAGNDPSGVDAFGQELLQGLQQFDPNARWTFEPGWSNEGGETPGGWRLDYDVTKLPNVGGPGGGNRFDHAGLVTAHNTPLRNADMVYNDPNFGMLTVQGNEQQDKTPWWVTAAPLAIGVVAPWAAGLAAASGIGAAGLSSAVTSGAYSGGAMAGGAAGGAAAGAGAGGASWWERLLTKAPSIARSVDTAISAPSAPVRPPPVAPAVAPTPKSSGYNPANFNNMGSMAKPSTANESALVATEFAADPYGNSY